MTSVTGRIEGLAVAYVDDFLVVIHEESPVSQKHFSDVKAVYESEEWESVFFFNPMWNAYRAGITIAGLVFCLVHTAQNRWFSWTCHQQDENSARIL